MRDLRKCIFQSVCILVFLFVITTVQAIATDSRMLYVSVNGDDFNPGTKTKPFATISKAKHAVRELKESTNKPIEVFVREGSYYLDEPVVFGPEDSGSKDAPIIYQAAEGERVTLSGGKKLSCSWKPYKDGIMMCELPEAKLGKLDFTQLFVNGKRQHLARYPNYDNSEPGHTGYILPQRAIPQSIVNPDIDDNQDMTQNDEPPRGIIYVTETGSGDFSGSSWANANGKLQSVIDKVAACDQVWVVKGTYKPTKEVGGKGDRYKTFQMKNGVTVYGGFAGSETSLALLYQGINAIEKIRTTLGATNPAAAMPGTVRSIYANDLMRNAAHASDSPENALREREIIDMLEHERRCSICEVIAEHLGAEVAG